MSKRVRKEASQRGPRARRPHQHTQPAPEEEHTPRLLRGPGPRPRRTPEEMMALGDDVRNNFATAELQGPWGVDVREDPVDDRINRKLADEIRMLVRKYKQQEGQQTFVIGWRLYPNAKHPRFSVDGNSCGCGCGCGG